MAITWWEIQVHVCASSVIQLADADSADWISSESACWSQSSSSSMSLPHEQGLTPFPLSQCWNMARQQSSGSPRYFCSIDSIFAPVSSKFIMYPRLRQWGPSWEMILIFPPAAVLRSNNWARVGGESEKERKMIVTNQQNTIGVP